MSHTPFVSIIMPVYNEELFLARCLKTIQDQDYPSKRMEILLIDGGSTDRSLDIIRHYQHTLPLLTVLNNSKRIIPTALNIGWQSAKGEIIVRMDAHTLYDACYVSESVRLLEKKDAANVGAIQRAAGDTFITKAIAMATTSPFGIGNAHFRTTSVERYADTAYLGSWYRSTLESLGGFREDWLVNEDYELNYRLRLQGLKVLISPQLQCLYFVRGSLTKLSKQYFRYGLWKAKTARVHPDSLMVRQLAPPLFVIALALSMLFSPLIGWGALIIPAAYSLANLYSSFRLSRKEGLAYLCVLPWIFFCLHSSWGAGFLAGLVRFGVPHIRLYSLLKNENIISDIRPDA